MEDNVFEFDEIYDIEDEEERDDLIGITLEEDEDEILETIELDAPVEEITVVDSMPEEVKNAINKFNSRTQKMRNLINDVKETREQEELFSDVSFENDEDDEEIFDDDISIEKDVFVTDEDINDLENFI